MNKAAAILDWSKSGIRPLLIAGVLLLALWPLQMESAYQIRIFTIVGIYALLALGYQFIFVR